MRRKEYHTMQARKKAQHKGFYTCLGVNLVLLSMQWTLRWFVGGNSAIAEANLILLIAIMPWAVNFAIIAGGLIFNPQFAIGYLAFIATAIIGSLVLGVWFVISCIVSAAIMVPASLLTPFLGGIVLIIVLPIIFLGGLMRLIGAISPQIRDWWSGEE